MITFNITFNFNKEGVAFARDYHDGSYHDMLEQTSCIVHGHSMCNCARGVRAWCMNATKEQYEHTCGKKRER